MRDFAPTTVTGSYLIARQAYKSKDLANAGINFEAALKEDPENRVLIGRAFLAELEFGNMTSAIKLAERGNRLGMTAPFMLTVLGLDRARAGDWSAAEDLFLRMPKSGLNDVLSRLLRGWAALGSGDNGLARIFFDEVKTLAGFDVLALLHAGHGARLSGDIDEADNAFAEAIKKSQRPPLRLSLAVAIHHAETGRLNKAKAILEERDEWDFNANKVAEILRRAKAGERVPGLVNTAADGMGEALFDLASALQRERRNNIAMILAQLATYMRPDFPLARLLVGEILDDRGKHERALTIYHGISSASPYHAMAQFRAAAGLQDLGRIDDAIALLRDFSTSWPDDPTPWIRIGDMQRAEKRWLDAVAAYDKAVSLIQKPGQGDWALFYTRGIALERAKQWKQAELDFLKALELSPDQPYVMNYLGYSWTEQGIYLDRAKQMIEKAVKLRPRDGYIVDSLGWVLFRTGRFQESVPKLERAVQLRPNDATINDHLGDAYWRVGRRIEARFQWRRALNMKPEPSLHDRIEHKLQNGLAAPESAKGNKKKADGERVPDA